MTKAEISYVQNRGWNVLRGCGDFGNMPSDLWKTLKMFIGGFSTNPSIPIFGSKTPDYQIKANQEMMKSFLGYDMPRREEIVDIQIDKNSIKSGDFFGLTRMDGLDNFINLGSGSRLGHTTIAMWDESDGELYITESQAGWYWPRDGIQRNKWEDWIKWAKNADMNIVHIPMKDEDRKNFNVEKAWKRYYELEGYDYGFKNFLFSSVDTPDHFLPDILDPIFISIVFQAIEKVSPETIDTIIGEALNKRLGTNGLRLAELWDQIFQKNTTFGEVMAIVEREEWVYSNGPNYVCSCYVTTILKASGVFGDIEFHSQEQSPKDLYSFDIWDFSGKTDNPECQSDMNKHGLNVCQIYGKMVLKLDDNPGYLKAYDHMGETCPSIGPDFLRTPGC